MFLDGGKHAPGLHHEVRCLTLKPGPNAFNEIGTLILANKVENSALPLCVFVGLKTSFLLSKPCNA